MTRVAVIDIGTNSTRLLVADVSGSGKVDPVYTCLKTTRLGEGIENGVLLPGPVSRTVGAIAEMKEKGLYMSASVIVAAATSAVRDAANRDRFVEEVLRETGIRIRVLYGPEEAYMSYLGVTAEFGGDLPSTVIVDIGGGSTEFTWKSGGVISCRSVNAGAVRMTEGGHGDRVILDIMKAALDEVKRDRPGHLIGVGGTVTTLAAIELGLKVYDRALVHGYTLTRAGIFRLLDMLVKAGPEGRKRIPGLQPARADIIVSGVRILLLIVEYLELKEIRVSEADLMYGLAIEGSKLSK
ncbi:MAG: Ppx/GppA family phosphatase [Bacillota bacterium]